MFCYFASGGFGGRHKELPRFRGFQGVDCPGMIGVVGLERCFRWVVDLDLEGWFGEVRGNSDFSERKCSFLFLVIVGRPKGRVFVASRFCRMDGGGTCR